MIGNKLGLDFLLGVKILRPTIGSWKIVERGRTWDDFACGRAAAMRYISATRRGHRCWIVAQRSEINGAAATAAWGAGASAHRSTYTYFTFYATNPRWHGVGDTSTLGSGFFIPKRLPQAYAQAISQSQRVA